MFYKSGWLFQPSSFFVFIAQFLLQGSNGRFILHYVKRVLWHTRSSMLPGLLFHSKATLYSYFFIVLLSWPSLGKSMHPSMIKKVQWRIFSPLCPLARKKSFSFETWDVDDEGEQCMVKVIRLFRKVPWHKNLRIFYAELVDVETKCHVYILCCFFPYFLWCESIRFYR